MPLSTVSFFLLWLCFTSAQEITYPPSQSYDDYSSTILYNVTSDVTDVTYLIEPSWELNFVGAIYSKCWFHTDGILSFDKPFIRDQSSSNEYVSLSSNPLAGARLLIKSTVDNFTIDYSACHQQNTLQTVRWIITYYRNTTNWVFDVDTRENGLPGDYGSIRSAVRGLNLYQQLDTTTIQLVRYSSILSTKIIGFVAGLIALAIAIFALCTLCVCCWYRGCKCCQVHISGNCAQFCNRVCCCCRRRGTIANDTYLENSKQQIRQESVESSATLKVVNPEEACHLCLDDGVEVESGCEHRFHLGCLREWYKRSRECPSCRQTTSVHLIRCRDCNKFSGRAFGPESIPEALSSCCKK